MASTRIQKAELLVAEGDKHMKTSMFKWAPDFDSAIDSYDKAVIQFKNASDYLSAVKLLLKIAELNENRSNFFNAGKALDNASACCRESNDLEGVLAYADQAANLFLQGAVPDTAFNTLTRAAKHVESTNTDAAIQFYKKAANLYKMEGGRIREAADVLARAACLEIRLSKWADCAITIERERDLRIEAGSFPAAARTNCCLILVHIKKGNFDIAKSCHQNGYKIIGDYDNTDAAQVMETLFTAIESSSLDDFTACLKSPYFRGLENDMVKMVRSIEMPEGAASEIDFNATSSDTKTPNYPVETMPDFNEEPDFT